MSDALDLAWALATAERLATEREQQRIIKLLEDTFGTSGIKTNVGGYVFVFDLAALIKGENADKAEVHTSADNTITRTHCDDCDDWGCHGCSCADVEDYCGTCGKGENK